MTKKKEDEIEELSEDIEDIDEDLEEIGEDIDEILKRIDRNQIHAIEAIEATRQNKWWIICLFLVDKFVMAMLIIYLGRYL